MTGVYVVAIATARCSSISCRIARLTRLRPGCRRSHARRAAGAASGRPLPYAQECDPLAAEPAQEVGRLPHPVVGRVTTVGSSVGAIPTPHRERRNSAAPQSAIGYHVLVSSGPNGVPGRTPRSAGLQQSRHGQADERASEASSRWTGLRALLARPKRGMVSERGRS